MMNIKLLLGTGLIASIGVVTAMLVPAGSVWAATPVVVTCGDGKTIAVADASRYAHDYTQLCLKAGHPPPVESQSHLGLATTAPGKTAASDSCPEWDPNSAKLPTGTCTPPQQTIKYDPNCARLNGCDDSGGIGNPGNLTSKQTTGPATLLLPAVQAAAGKTCGSDVSISAALDQCGDKGFVSASCKKTNGQWNCEPSDDKSDPNLRSTGFKIGR